MTQRQSGSYARPNTAERDQTVNGNSSKENYEQVITLPKPVAADKLQIDRKQNVVVISVPKTSTSAPNVAAASSPLPTAASSPSPTVSSSAGSTDWNDIMSNQFAAMQREMDQAFHDVFANDSAGASTSQVGSAVNVDDQKDKYVVHFYLPDRDLTNVNVNFENGRLHLTAEEQKNQTNNTANGSIQSSSSGRYGA